MPTGRTGGQPILAIARLTTCFKGYGQGTAGPFFHEHLEGRRRRGYMSAVRACKTCWGIHKVGGPVHKLGVQLWAGSAAVWDKLATSRAVLYDLTAPLCCN